MNRPALTDEERTQKRRKAVLGHAKMRCFVCLPNSRCGEYEDLFRRAVRNQSMDFVEALETEVMLVSRFHVHARSDG